MYAACRCVKDTVSGRTGEARRAAPALPALAGVLGRSAGRQSTGLFSDPPPPPSGGRFAAAACKNPGRCTWHHKPPNSTVARPPGGRVLPCATAVGWGLPRLPCGPPTRFTPSWLTLERPTRCQTDARRMPDSFQTDRKPENWPVNPAFPSISAAISRHLRCPVSGLIARRDASALTKAAGAGMCRNAAVTPPHTARGLP